MERTSIIKERSKIGKSQFHFPLHFGVSKDFEEEYFVDPKFIKIKKVEDLYKLSVPYTIDEIIEIRQRIDKILVASQEIASYQSITLLNQLCTKISFKMALLTLIRSKPIAAIKAIGLSIMALSMIGFLLNIVFREPLVSPYLILYFFYFGLIMAAMAFIERVQRRHIYKHKSTL
jgi:hypothetical protein